MFLKSLAARAIVPVAVAVTGFVIICCILLYTVMKTDMINDAVRHETNLADTIVKSTRYAMLKYDCDTLHNIISNIGQQKGVEHVRIFNKKGLIMFSADPAEYKRLVDKKTAGCIGCHSGAIPTSTLGAMEQARHFTNGRGAQIIAITAPIYNESACYNAGCHIHNANQKILGTLDIGLSGEPLLKTLALMRSRMVLFSLMVLFLTVGGAAALLRRHVFGPIRELKNFTGLVNRDAQFDDFPHISGELADLAKDVRGLVYQLRTALSEVEILKDRQG
ncbi:MAG: hypothetical protein WA133_13890 [Syntrophales bacterium]